MWCFLVVGTVEKVWAIVAKQHHQPLVAVFKTHLLIEPLDKLVGVRVTAEGNANFLECKQHFFISCCGMQRNKRLTSVASLLFLIWWGNQNCKKGELNASLPGGRRY